MLLVLLTRVLLWASVGVLIWYILARIIPPKYLTLLGGFILILLLAASFVDPGDSTIRVIWQILSFPLSPLGAAIVFLSFALSEGTKGIKGTPAAIALSILLVFSIPIIAQWLVSGAEQSVRTAYEARAEVCGEVCRDGQIPNQGNLAEAAAIVVLGDSSDIDKAINVSDSPNEVSINTALAPRLIYAANLYDQARRRGADPFVVVTAGAGRDDSQQRNIIRDILFSNGVPLNNIRTETTGLDIRSTGLQVENLLEDAQLIADSAARRDREEGTKNDPRVVIVAPAILMSRAALTFEKMDLEVIAKPTDFYTSRFELGGSLLNKLPELLPSVDALQITTKYWNELLTSLYYFLRGWLPNFNFGWDSSIEI
ncbi:MAG: YdcF family protein [Phormidesmis sp. RL_2_1]|nr:YdcF family protein [Phormidesmis sp. RL_2_1]